jgi:hypothetical protein
MSDRFLLLSDVDKKNVQNLVSLAYTSNPRWFDEPDDGLYYEAIWELGSVPQQVGELFVSVERRLGGGEGSGEYMDIVWKIADCDTARYFKETGRYYSFVGGEWNDDIHEVFPKQKEITVYE